MKEKTLKTTDDLTSLLNYTVFKKSIQGTYEQYVMEVNIKRFISVNDCSGHNVGDEILKLYAKYLEKSFGYNNVFRYSGNSFTILFNYKDMITTIEKIKCASNIEIFLSIYGRDNELIEKFLKEWEEYNNKITNNENGGLYIQTISLSSTFQNH